jgi:hypothetical protein
MTSYYILRALQYLCKIPCFCKLHPDYFFLVVHIFSLRASHFQIDEVVEVLADLLDVYVW